MPTARSASASCSSSRCSPTSTPPTTSLSFANRLTGVAANGDVTLNEAAGFSAPYTSTATGNALIISGGAGTVAAGGTATIKVGVNTATAGAKSGTVTISDNNIDADDITVSGNVFSLATLPAAIAAGDAIDYSATFDTTNLGVFSATYQLLFCVDDNMSGAASAGAQPLNFTLSGNVVSLPEPASLALHAAGDLLLLARRRRA